MDQAFGVLMGFIASQLAIIGLGLVPPKYWRGIKARTKPGAAASLPVAPTLPPATAAPRP